MNRNTRFTIVTIISFLSLLLVGVYTAHAQDSPLKSGTDRGGAQTAVSVEPVPLRGGATQGPPDLHPESRQRRPPGPSPFSDIQAAIKVQPQNQVNTGSKTPCSSPKCLGEALAIKKQPIVKTDVMKATSGKVTSSGFTGKARTGRR
jgi:hypothetical protein